MAARKRTPRRGGMFRNFMHLGVGQATTILLTIALNAALARALSPSDFGLLFLVTSIAGFFYVIVDWGHGPLIIREAARNPERSGNLLGSSLAVRSAIVLLACGCAVAATWLLGYDVRTRVLAAVLILCWWPQTLGLSFGWVFRACERMGREAMLSIVLKVATLLGSIACLALGGELVGLMFTWSVAGGLTLAFALSTYRRLALPRFSATVATAKELMRDGAPAFAMAAAIAVEPLINTNILFKMSSATVVGWFGASWTIAGSLLAPASVLSAATYPRLSVASGDPVEFKRAFDLSIRPLLLLAVLGAVGTYLFADVPIALIYGLGKFGPAADTLRAFAPVLLLIYVDLFLGYAILAAGKAVRMALLKVTSVVLTTGLAFVLVPICQARWENGGLGVMYALATGELFLLVVSARFLRGVVDRRTIGHVGRTLAAGVGTALLFQWLTALHPMVGIPLCVVVFVALSLLVGAVKRSELTMLLRFPRAGASAP